ncbi:MAG TPA: ankyrin repeat domain-containing protein [Egibacteraceae bacterium]|nr:ankyrin repeat domain-containing protein [Egibacteraceae bacterium]
MADAIELLDAIAARDVAQVERLLAVDPSLAAARGEDAISAVLLARYHSDFRILELLLQAGPPLDIFESAAIGELGPLIEATAADHPAVDSFSADGYTPLHLAAFFGNDDCAQYLLEQDAAVDAVSRNDMALQPLHSAAAGGHVVVAGMLLQRGAEVDARQHGGWTALHAAAQHGDTALCELLLRYGADPGLRNEGGTVAAELVPRDNAELVELLLWAWLSSGRPGDRRDG